MDSIIIGLISTILGLWFGSIEWRIRSMDSRLRQSPSREEVERTIDNKQEAIKVLQKEIKEDISDMRNKLDQIITMQLNNH